MQFARQWCPKRSTFLSALPEKDFMRSAHTKGTNRGENSKRVSTQPTHSNSLYCIKNKKRIRESSSEGGRMAAMPVQAEELKKKIVIGKITNPTKQG